MTIRLTEADVEEQYQEADEEELQFDPSDELDITLKYSARYIQGWTREINLRQGIHLSINQTGPATDRAIIPCSRVESSHIYCDFLLSGSGQHRLTSALREIEWIHAAKGYWLSGTGSRGQLIQDYDVKPWSSISLEIPKTTFHSFTTSPDGEMPKHLQHLVRPVSQEIYRRIGDIQPTMAAVLQQILRCPYQGMVKRAYLESKVIELMALVLDREIAIQRGEDKQVSLKSEQIERIHYAREILLRDFNNPPSLAELAHQAGLNEFTLKQGFRQVFGTTVFGELRAYRLDIAKQLLAEGDLSIAEVAYCIGYASLSSFYRAFRRKFGITPKEYQKACR